MSIFGKKETIYLYSESQKDDFIKKLEKAHVDYRIREDRDNVFSNHTTYVLRLDAKDLKKVV